MSDVGKAGAVGSAMPADEQGLRILRERAELLALPMDRKGDRQRDLYIRFRLGAREEYAVPYPFLEEIMPTAVPTRVPGTPPHIAGVVNRQSELLTILDLKRLFGISGNGGREGGGVIVVTAGGVTAGLWADFIVGNDYYDHERLHAPLSSEGGVKSEFVAGIDCGTVTVLNIEALFADAALKVR